MVARRLLGTLLLLSLAHCGIVDDPAPEEDRENLSLRAGKSKTWSILVLVDDEMAGDFTSWEDRVRDLPPGFHFETVDVDKVEVGDELAVEIVYRIRVDADVRPRRYDFDVKYDFTAFDEVFRQQVNLEIFVDVREPRR